MIRRRLLVATHHLLLAGVTLLGPKLAAQGATAPQQEIWYHTGCPGGVVGLQSGMSALTGPTKMPAVFEAIVRGRLAEPAQLHTDSAMVPGRAPAAPPIDLESLQAVHTDRYIRAILTGDPATWPPPKDYPPGLRTSPGGGC